MSTPKEKRDAGQADASYSKCMRSQKLGQVAENSQPSGKNDFEESFQQFTKHYKEELNLYKRNIKRLCEKSQELEISVLEYKGALERSQEAIIEKDNVIEKQIAEQNHIKDEKYKLVSQYNKLEKEFVNNELKYAKQLEQISRENIINEMQINKEREHHKNIVQELTGNLENVTKKLEAEKEEVLTLKKQLEQTTQSYEEQIKQLQATFAEQKLFFETENQHHINELKEEHQHKDENIQKYMKENENFVKEIENKLHTINQQAEAISKLKDELGVCHEVINEFENEKKRTFNEQAEEIEQLKEKLAKSQELISNFENEKKRLAAEQDFRLSTIERVFADPVNSKIPKRSLADEITASVTKPQTSVNSTGITSNSSAKNTTNEGTAKLRGQRSRGNQRQHKKEEEEALNNQIEKQNLSNISSSLLKTRAAKRKMNFALYNDYSSSDTEENTTQLNMEPLKLPHLDPPCSASTTISLMRFTTNNKAGEDHLVVESSESDAFDRLKGQ